MAARSTLDWYFYRLTEWLELVHCEINAWQHLLNIIYREAVQIGTFTKFIDILSVSAVGRRHGEEIRELSVKSQGFLR